MKNDYAQTERDKRITAEELTAEIFPLLTDCFEGELRLMQNGILYALPNGQVFMVSVKSVA